MKLRNVVDSDIQVFFSQSRETHVPMPHAMENTEEAFSEKWKKIRANAENVVRTIEVEDQVAGYVASFFREGVREVSYWLGRRYWGQGIATEALTTFLTQDGARPMFARAAKSNVASIRVLEKVGFAAIREESIIDDATKVRFEELVFSRET